MICGECKYWSRCLTCNGLSFKGYCNISNQEAHDKLSIRINEKKEFVKLLHDPVDIFKLQTIISDMEVARQSVRIITRKNNECIINGNK